METRGIAVFDVCGTVTKTNNTFDFISFVLKRDRSFRYGLFLLIRIVSFLSRLLGIRSTSGRSLLRDYQIALLRGYSPARVREMSAQYVNHLLAQGLFNGTVLEAMKREREAGRTVWLVSAAIDPPIAEIARRLGIEDYSSSELEMENGRYTGKLRTDLLGRKESTLEKISPRVDWQDSSVYSDNAEDARFMGSFGRRTIVLNTSAAGRTWDRGIGEFHCLVNYEVPSATKDVHSVNERVVKWTYVPTLYYIISRLHRQGLLSLLLREMIPVTLTGYLVTNLDVLSLVLLPLSFLMFYSIYEIGGLVNDLLVGREAPEQGTDRIAPQVSIDIGLFIGVRVALVGLLAALLPLRGGPLVFYIAALAFCLTVYLLHTLILSHLRVLTFTLLKVCRSFIPLLVLASRLPLGTLIYLGAIFSAMEVAWKVYVYSCSRGLVHGAIPPGHIRCVNATILWALGAVAYLVAGSPYLLAIASYYVVLDGLWAMYKNRVCEPARPLRQHS